MYLQGVCKLDLCQRCKLNLDYIHTTNWLNLETCENYIQVTKSSIHTETTKLLLKLLYLFVLFWLANNKTASQPTSSEQWDTQSGDCTESQLEHLFSPLLLSLITYTEF